MKKIFREVGAVVITFLFIATNILIVMPNVAACDCYTAQTDIYKSDTTDLWWSGANSGNIDGSGYIVPPGTAIWSASKYCWNPGWDSSLTPLNLKTELFDTPAADWIWGPLGPDNKVTVPSSYTGDIVFFKKNINIPPFAYDITADLFVITADNAYYFFINDDWSGVPDGSAGFIGTYNPTDFYYTSDGVNNLGGGTDSVTYETPGNLYPLDASISTDIGAWSSIELYDISSLLHTGDNWLQIVGINEHAPPESPESNPAGLLYKVIVEYKLPIKITVEKQVQDPTTGDWVDAIRVPIGTLLNFSIMITTSANDVLNDVHVVDTLSSQLEYRNNANYPATSVSPDLRTVIWDFPTFEIGEKKTITYKVEAVQQCYGYNEVIVTTCGNAISLDLVKVKVHGIGQPVMGVTKSIWNEKTNSWEETGTALLGRDVRFRLLITSTSLEPLDVSILDTLPDYLEFRDDSTLTPLEYTSQSIQWNLDQVQPGDVKEIIYNAAAVSEGVGNSVVSLLTSDNNYNEDSVVVKIVDPPSIDLCYPRGGETLDRTVTIEWQSSDTKDSILYSSFLYYRNSIDGIWQSLCELHDGSSEYVWSTSLLQEGSYQLQVVTQDTDGLFDSDTSGFFVIEHVQAPTVPPQVPAAPSGETSVTIGTEAVYASQSTDVDSQEIYFQWDWGDSTSSDWFGPFTSGEIVSVAHLWNQEGSYQIRVKAKDNTGLVSDWSDPLGVSITKNTSTLKTLFIQFLEKMMNKLPVLAPVIQLILHFLSSSTK